MYAHYTATKNVKFITLSATTRPDASAPRIIVAGRAEAKRKAAALGATLWN